MITQDEMRASVASAIRDGLYAQEMTQKTLAEITGIPASRICPIFNGQKMPSLYNAYLIADVLGITLDDMIRYKPMEGEEQPCT